MHCSRPLVFILIAVLIAPVLPQQAYADCTNHLEVSMQKTPETLYFRLYPKEPAASFKIEYWIENSEGEIIRPKYNTTKNSRKQFSIKGRSGFIILKARLFLPGCGEAVDSYMERIPLPDSEDLPSGENKETGGNKPPFVSVSEAEGPAYEDDVHRGKGEAADASLLSYSGSQQPLSRTSGEVYTSSSLSLVQLAVFILLGTSLILNAILIWRR